MPVYFRRNQAFTPSSLAEGPDDTSLDESDFIQDPEQVRDRLPQPFRMINKIIENLIDAASQRIIYRETERVKDATRIRPPQYQCGLQVEGVDGTGCMATSPDGKLVILGLSSGLAVIQADTQSPLAIWRDTTELVNLSCSTLEDGKYIVSSIDDMGVARLFIYHDEALFLLATLNEQEGDKRLIATRCETSDHGQFVGMCFESAGNQESWLEFHRCPRDTWIKEVENAAKSVKKDSAVLKSANSTPRADGGADGPDSGSARDLEPQSSDHRPESPSSHRGDSSPPPEKTSYKFTGLTLALRVRPQSPPTGVTWSSPYQLSRTIDHNGEIVGTGASHQVSSQHLEQRQTMFEGKHHDLLQYEDKDAQQPLQQGNFHFLTGGRLLPHGLDHSSAGGQPNSVFVWWAGHPQVTMYSLTKQAKDVEHKPDVVWPLSSGVVTSTVSPCSSLLVFGLENKNVLIWDKYMGLPRRVVRLPGKGDIVSLDFLDPSLSDQGDTTRAYQRHSQVSLLAVCGGGDVYIVPCGPGNNDPPQLVPMSIEHPSEQPSLVKPLIGIPELLVTCRQNGQVFLHDITRDGHQLCEITLPPSYKLSSPWQPVIAIGNSGEMMYLRSTHEAEEEDVKDTLPVFVFQLRSFPALDVYRQKQRPNVPYMVHSTVQQRVDALLRHRLSEQSGRKDRMQTRWHQLTQELAHLQHLRSSRQQDGRKSAVQTLGPR